MYDHSNLSKFSGKKIDCTQIGRYDVMLFYMMSYESIGTELMMNQNAKLNLTVF